MVAQSDTDGYNVWCVVPWRVTPWNAVPWNAVEWSVMECRSLLQSSALGAVERSESRSIAQLISASAFEWHAL